MLNHIYAWLRRLWRRIRRFFKGKKEKTVLKKEVLVPPAVSGGGFPEIDLSLEEILERTGGRSLIALCLLDVDVDGKLNSHATVCINDQKWLGGLSISWDDFTLSRWHKYQWQANIHLYCHEQYYGEGRISLLQNIPGKGWVRTGHMGHDVIIESDGLGMVSVEMDFLFSTPPMLPLPYHDYLIAVLIGD